MHSRTNRIADAPLFAWGEALRARRQRRRRMVKRSVALALGTLPILATIVLPPMPRLVWNASASAPIGLYAVSPGAPARTGDTVIARLPASYRYMAATRRYLPLNVPLVKRVAAAHGDQVCALGPRIFINGAPAALRRATDMHGRAMPWWNGCERLGPDRLLLLMTASPDSFDGRYFGPSDRADVLGTARLVWAR